jgi:hypothetical protein
MTYVLRIVLAALLLSVLTAASCSENKELTCTEIELGAGSKITTWDCNSAETSVVGGKLYVKNAKGCTKKEVTIGATTTIRRYTEKDDITIDVPIEGLPLPK